MILENEKGRRDTRIINDGWEFAKVDGKMEDGLPNWPDKTETVSIPHTWYQFDDYYRGLAVYRKTVGLSGQKKAYLEFGGADQWCRVYLNGRLAGEHKGAYSTFRVPVGEQDIRDGKVEITVLLDNRENEEISPIFGDFTVYGGLYRTVSLITVPEQHFNLMYHGTKGIVLRASLDGDWGVLRIEPHVAGVSKEDASYIRYEIWGYDGCLAATGKGAVDGETVIRVQSPVLWDGIGKGYLYRLRSVLVVGDAEADEVELPFGFRKVAIDSEEGFFLNGRHVRIHGVAKHQDREGCFNAVTEANQKKDIELIREIGANAVRLSHYQHPQYTYDLCDREGLIVWAEIPMLKMTENPKLLENACEQLRELILQNIHHPCICFWGIQNEIAMFRDSAYMWDGCQKLYDMAISLDDTRLITAANLHGVKTQSPLNRITDMVGYNIYFGWYYGEMADYDSYLDTFHKEQPDIPIGISEYGVDCNLAFHSLQPKVKDYSEEFQSLFHETVYPILEKKSYLWGSFIWNMFDFGSGRRNEGGTRFKNCKGLVTFGRDIKKDSFYYYKARWSKEPFLHLAEKRFEKRCQKEMAVKVYTNVSQAVLYLNGERVGEGKEKQAGVFIFDPIPLRIGENVVRVESGELEDEAVFVRTEQEEKSYIFEDPSAGGNVKNWFLDEAEAMVKEGFFSLKDLANDLAESPAAMEVLREYMPEDAARIEREGGMLSLERIILYGGEKYHDLNVKELAGKLGSIRKEQ